MPARMKPLAISVTAGLLLILCGARAIEQVDGESGGLAIVDGVAATSPREAITPQPTIEALLPPPPGAVVINFDEVTAPCGFIETTALRDRYSALGVVFSGPAPLDGGAVLNQCGSFGVTGHSQPNFLAFNLAAIMSNGGRPMGPETIRFTAPVSQLQLSVGSYISGDV